MFFLATSSCSSWKGKVVKFDECWRYANVSANSMHKMMQFVRTLDIFYAASNCHLRTSLFLLGKTIPVTRVSEGFVGWLIWYSREMVSCPPALGNTPTRGGSLLAGGGWRKRLRHSPTASRAQIPTGGGWAAEALPPPVSLRKHQQINSGEKREGSKLWNVKKVQPVR